MTIPEKKIEVFISSACSTNTDKHKYNIARAGLKNLIEATNIAKAYTFESDGASSVPAGQQYKFALEDSDVCIFFIDNEDGVPDGVAKEISIAKKHNIKSIYYFCSQFSTEETRLEKSLMGSTQVRTKKINSFEDFISQGATDLIDEIVSIYKSYCKGRLEWKDNTFEDAEINKIDSVISANSLIFDGSIARKEILDNIDCCNTYFYKLILGRSGKKVENSDTFDELCAEFLPVLFEGVGVDEKSFNMLKGELKKQQPESYYLVTEKRLDAIKAFYNGHLSECVSILDEALALAKSKSLSDWVINDILIDLRNQHSALKQAQNRFSFNSIYQKELQESASAVYYPLIDRFDSEYYKELLTNMSKYVTESPYTITLGSGLRTEIESLSSSYVLALYNGSLTHLNMLYKKIFLLAFYSAEKYSNWSFRKLLIKISIFGADKKEIDGIMRYFSDILGKMNAEDAYEIYCFANNIPIAHKLFSAKLEAFRIVGYILDDEQFNAVWSELRKLMFAWIEDDDATDVVANHIFSVLDEVCYRIEHEQIADIVCNCLNLRRNRFYDELFRIITKLNLSNLTIETSHNLLSAISEIVADGNERKHISTLSVALYTLRNHSHTLTKTLDKTISEHMPDFYAGIYKLETSTRTDDLSAFIENYTALILERNQTQGKDGQYSIYGDRPHRAVKLIIQQSKSEFDMGLITSAFRASYDTLLSPRQTFAEKIEAIDLMIYLIMSYDNDVICSKGVSAEILNNKNLIESGKDAMANLSEINLKLCALLLYNCLGEDISTEVIEALAYIGDDKLSQIYASRAFESYLSVNCIELDQRLESTIIQNAVMWCNSPVLDVRWNAVRILFYLLSNPQNKNIVCNQLVKLMDSDNAYIKNSILRMIYRLKNIDIGTHEYIIQKARLDNDFTVRKLVAELYSE